MIMTKSNIPVTIEKLVKKSIVKPSEQFGLLFLEVDHGVIGRQVKQIRQRRKVKAVDVAKKLGVSKVQVHFMESGRKQWSSQSLEDYLKAVLASTNGHVKKTKKK